MPNRGHFSRLFVLYLVAILFVILNISDIKIAGLSDVMPMLDLMMVFYFTIIKNIFPIWFVFLLGLWSDSLNGNVLGITSLCYILTVKFFILANNKLMIKENFSHIWQQFIGFCFMFLMMKWALLSLFNSSLYNVINPLVQLALSSALYVIMHKFFDYLNDKLFS